MQETPPPVDDESREIEAALFDSPSPAPAELSRAIYHYRRRLEAGEKQRKGVLA